MEIELSNSKSFLICGLLFILLFMGCQSKGTIAVVAQSTPTVPTRINLPTATIKPVTTTATRQSTATRIVITATLIPSPVPTLSLAEKEIVTSELYKTNGNCELPCWWGIVPGKTEWKTAELFLNTFTTEISTGSYLKSDPKFVVEAYMPVTEDLSEINLLTQSYSVNDGVIEIIHPERPRGTSKIFTISEILNTFDRPTEVWIDTIGVTFGDYFPFRITLFYPEKGILVRYFDDAGFSDDHLTGCPQDHSGKLTLWATELNLTFAEALNGTRGLGTFGEQYNKPLEEVTEMDVEAFYQTYLDPDTETCIETSAELWMDR